MRILFLADVFGTAGRRAVEERLPPLREELGVDFCVVNGENAADGRGITPKLADKLLASGADVVTLGNHVWAREEIGRFGWQAREPSVASQTASAFAREMGLTTALVAHDDCGEYRRTQDP